MSEAAPALRPVSTAAAPAPGGHYAQGVVAGGLVFVSGQLPFTPERTMPEGIEAQARQTLGNVRQVLEAAGSALEAVASLQVFVVDLAHWPTVDAVCREAFGAHRPARTVVPCGPLRHGALLEINATAVVQRAATP